ncbi:MAG: alpha/beta hydrolase, partial [Planctomycetota bacterium]
PFTNLADVAQAHYWFLPASLLITEKFDSASKIKKITCPALFIIGKQDKIVPANLSLELFDKAPEPKEFYEVDYAGHNDIQCIGGTKYWDKINNWINSLP